MDAFETHKHRWDERNTAGREIPLPAVFFHSYLMTTRGFPPVVVLFHSYSMSTGGNPLVVVFFHSYSTTTRGIAPVVVLFLSYSTTTRGFPLVVVEYSFIQVTRWGDPPCRVDFWPTRVAPRQYPAPETLGCRVLAGVGSGDENVTRPRPKPYTRSINL